MAHSLTVRDSIDLLRDWAGGNAGTNSEQNIRAAIELALGELAQSRLWSPYQSMHRIFLRAPYSTGTITYDHAGGASDRLVTLDGGTWPADMQTEPTSWDILVGNVASRVASYLSSTTITLDPVLNFGSDIAAGASFQVLKPRYLLPTDFRCLDEGVAESLWHAAYVEPRDWLYHQRISLGSGPPCRWTVTGDSQNVGRSMMLVDPAPAEDETLDMWYQRQPRELIYSGYNPREYAGTVSTSGVTVTGINTEFEAGMVGSIIRFGSNSQQVPTRKLGLYPFQHERRIVGYTSGTSITIDSAITGNVSGVKYVVSDLIDLDPTMRAAFARGCEYQLSVLKKGSSAEQQRTWGAYQASLGQAAGSDRKVYVPRFAGDRPHVGRRLGDLPYNPTVIE